MKIAHFNVIIYNLNNFYTIIDFHFFLFFALNKYYNIKCMLHACH